MKTNVLIAGANGMVGKALVKELKKNNSIKLLTPGRNEVDYLKSRTRG